MKGKESRSPSDREKPNVPEPAKVKHNFENVFSIDDLPAGQIPSGEPAQDGVNRVSQSPSVQNASFKLINTNEQTVKKNNFYFNTNSIKRKYKKRQHSSTASPPVLKSSIVTTPALETAKHEADTPVPELGPAELTQLSDHHIDPIPAIKLENSPNAQASLVELAKPVEKNDDNVFTQEPVTVETTLTAEPSVAALAASASILEAIPAAAAETTVEPEAVASPKEETAPETAPESVMGAVEETEREKAPAEAPVTAIAEQSSSTSEAEVQQDVEPEAADEEMTDAPKEEVSEREQEVAPKDTENHKESSAELREAGDTVTPEPPINSGPENPQQPFSLASFPIPPYLQVMPSFPTQQFPNPFAHQNGGTDSSDRASQDAEGKKILPMALPVFPPPPPALIDESSSQGSAINWIPQRISSRRSPEWEANNLKALLQASEMSPEVDVDFYSVVGSLEKLMEIKKHQEDVHHQVDDDMDETEESETEDQLAFIPRKMERYYFKGESDLETYYAQMKYKRYAPYVNVTEGWKTGNAGHSAKRRKNRMEILENYSFLTDTFSENVDELFEAKKQQLLEKLEAVRSGRDEVLVDELRDLAEVREFEILRLQNAMNFGKNENKRLYYDDSMDVYADLREMVMEKLQALGEFLRTRKDLMKAELSRDTVNLKVDNFVDEFLKRKERKEAEAKEEEERKIAQLKAEEEAARQLELARQAQAQLQAEAEQAALAAAAAAKAQSDRPDNDDTMDTDTQALDPGNSSGREAGAFASSPVSHLKGTETATTSDSDNQASQTALSNLENAPKPVLPEPVAPKPKGRRGRKKKPGPVPGKKRALAQAEESAPAPTTISKISPLLSPAELEFLTESVYELFEKFIDIKDPGFVISPETLFPSMAGDRSYYHPQQISTRSSGNSVKFPSSMKRVSKLTKSLRDSSGFNNGLVAPSSATTPMPSAASAPASSSQVAANDHTQQLNKVMKQYGPPAGLKDDEILDDLKMLGSNLSRWVS